jgi:hypothetical protein
MMGGDFRTGFYIRTGVPLPEEAVGGLAEKYLGSDSIAESIYRFWGIENFNFVPGEVAQILDERAPRLD